MDRAVKDQNYAPYMSQPAAWSETAYLAEPSLKKILGVQQNSEYQARTSNNRAAAYKE
jgi:hypothetical protein